jgi:hypothetical protein
MIRSEKSTLRLGENIMNEENNFIYKNVIELVVLLKYSKYRI